MRTTRTAAVGDGITGDFKAIGIDASLLTSELYGLVATEAFKLAREAFGGMDEQSLVENFKSPYEREDLEFTLKYIDDVWGGFEFGYGKPMKFYAIYKLGDLDCQAVADASPSYDKFTEAVDFQYPHGDLAEAEPQDVLDEMFKLLYVRFCEDLTKYGSAMRKRTEKAAKTVMKSVLQEKYDALKADLDKLAEAAADFVIAEGSDVNLADENSARKIGDFVLSHLGSGEIAHDKVAGELLSYAEENNVIGEILAEVAPGFEQEIVSAVLKKLR